MIGTTSSKGYHIIEAKQDTDIIWKHTEENVNKKNDIYENRTHFGIIDTSTNEKFQLSLIRRNGW